jgi:hypothetical protein
VQRLAYGAFSPLPGASAHPARAARPVLSLTFARTTCFAFALRLAHGPPFTTADFLRRQGSAFTPGRESTTAATHANLKG